jgi:hypothetical protein
MSDENHVKTLISTVTVYKEEKDSVRIRFAVRTSTSTNTYKYEPLRVPVRITRILVYSQPYKYYPVVLEYR